MRVIVLKWVHLVVKREKNKERERERRVARVTVSGGRHCVWLYSGLSQAKAGSWVVPATAYVHWQSIWLMDSFEFHMYKLCPASSGRHPMKVTKAVWWSCPLGDVSVTLKSCLYWLAPSEWWPHSCTGVQKKLKCPLKVLCPLSKTHAHARSLSNRHASVHACRRPLF